MWTRKMVRTEVCKRSGVTKWRSCEYMYSSLSAVFVLCIAGNALYTLENSISGAWRIKAMSLLIRSFLEEPINHVIYRVNGESIKDHHASLAYW